MVGGCWRLLSPAGELDSERTEGAQVQVWVEAALSRAQNVKGSGAAWLTTSDLFQSALL